LKQGLTCYNTKLEQPRYESVQRRLGHLWTRQCKSIPTTIAGLMAHGLDFVSISAVPRSLLKHFVQRPEVCEFGLSFIVLNLLRLGQCHVPFTFPPQHRSQLRTSPRRQGSKGKGSSKRAKLQHCEAFLSQDGCTNPEVENVQVPVYA
jgi:hypothetical protein